MKVNIDFELEESVVLREIVKKFMPEANMEKSEEITCEFGSAGQIVNPDRTINVHYEVDSRIIPGLYGVLKKHEGTIQGIIMMATGLYKTFSIAIKSIAEDTQKFFEDFKAQKQEEAKSHSKAAVVDDTDYSKFENAASDDVA